MKLAIIFACFVAMIILVSGCVQNQVPVRPLDNGQINDQINNQNPQTFQNRQNNDQREDMISVKATNSIYKTVSSKPGGWFSSGQPADILLSGIGFNNAGGPLLFNHPGVVASDGAHLILSDRNNNRVLIWNSLPTQNTEPDIVLGQKDFISNDPGTGLDQMNWPVSVSVGGGKLAVTDTNNDRILVWNSFPVISGQPADIVINSGIINSPSADNKRSIFWPWGVWTDGKKLAVTSTRNGIILLWNSFPLKNDQPADIYLKGQGKIGTPRTITSDGNHLIVGDHNSKVANGGTGQPAPGNFVWKSWPTTDDQPYDFFMQNPSDPNGAWMQGAFTDDNKLAMIGTGIHIWNSFPQDSNDQPDISVGIAGFGQNVYKLNGGDGSGIAIVGNRLYASLSNGNKIVGFNAIPATTTAAPDFVIGSPDINTNTLDTNFIMSNPQPATDGKSLFVSSDFDKRLYVYKNLPDESNAHPDFVYTLPAEPWDMAISGSKLALAGKKTVFVWNTLPLNGELPDKTFTDRIGNVQFQDLKGVAIDTKYFYLSDAQAGKIYVWDGMPSTDSNPVFVINADSPERLSSDGNYLACITPNSGGSGSSVKIYRISELSSNSIPIDIGNRQKFNLPQGVLVSQGHLFVGGTGVQKVFMWKNVEDAIAGKDADVILGSPMTSRADTYTLVPEIGQDKLFMPATLAFDGSYLWVGEFKFSERLLRFSVR